MPTIKELLTHMRLGMSVAEFDEDLENYFVQTNVFNEFVHGRKDIIAGDKGTGKTAIFRYINRNFSAIPELEGKLIIPAFNPTGSPIFSQLTSRQDMSEAEFTALWKFYILSLSANVYISHDSRLEGGELDNLVKALNIKTTTPTPKSVFNKVISAIPNFFQWKSAEMSFSLNELGMPVIIPKIEFDNSKSNNDEKIFISAEDALLMLENVLAKSDMDIWITFDRLDEAFQGHPEVEVKALRALLRTYLDLADLEHVKIKLFLRRDLFRRITTGGFVNLTHINAKKIEIIWDEEDLLNLIARRIRENKHFTDALQISQASDSEIFDLVFPDQVDFGLRKPKTWVWIMRRIRDGNDVKPPRNLIDLINNAREAQLRKEDRNTRDYDSPPLIEPDALRKGLSLLSESRVNDTLIAESGVLASEIEKFRGGKAEHNAESLAATLNIPLENVSSAIKPLKDIGFLEESGGTYKIPALYREGLEVTQGKAFADQNEAADED